MSIIDVPDRVVPVSAFDERTGLASKAWYEFLASIGAAAQDHETRLAGLEALNAGSRLAALEGLNAGSRLAALEAFQASALTRLTALELGPAAQNWTPVDTSGAGLVLTINNATYAKYGNMVVAAAYIIYPPTGSGLTSSIGGFPFAVANGASYTSFAVFTSAGGGGCVVQFVGSSFNIFSAGPAVAITNAQLSGNFVICGFSFPTTT